MLEKMEDYVEKEENIKLKDYLDKEKIAEPKDFFQSTVEKIWISKLPIKNSLKYNLIKNLGGVHNFYNASLDDLIDLGTSENAILKIHDLDLREECFKDYEYMQKNKIEIISIEENEYPEKLKQIDDMPIVIYVKGNKNILNNEAVRNCRF
jgi:predicted Rossmann fold nucleotide-binding protein DprA/Smf involved in DNA uptake